MRFAVIADTHIGRSIPLAVASYRRTAFNNAFTCAVNTCVECGVDYVFIVGDLFERRTLRPYLVQFVHDELYRLYKENLERHGVKVKILVVRGNHDGRPQSDTLDYIKHPLADYLHVFGDDPDEAIYSDDKVQVMGINYYDQISKAFEYFSSKGFADDDRLRIIMVHHFVRGYNEVPPYSDALTIGSLNALNPDFVFTGHYHRRCKPKKLSKNGWILTPGSLEMYDFAEDPDKGFYIVETTEDGESFKWIHIEPMHVMRQVNVVSDRRRPPQWFMENVDREIQSFVDELNRTERSGYIRIVVKGQLSEGFPSDINTLTVREVVERESHLLWVDLETMMLDLPPMMVRPEINSSDVTEFFSDFGDFSHDIREMHVKVKDALDNEASEQTGLLTPTGRSRFILDWVERFKSRRFKESEA
jgi:DNA repair exonuclease SbcCD nuclease subunit